MLAVSTEAAAAAAAARRRWRNVRCPVDVMVVVLRRDKLADRATMSEGTKAAREDLTEDSRLW